jgi:hypothetical protein
MTPKAASDDLNSRFREIVSDPLNILIERHPEAGFLDGGLVCLHNGIKVPASGPESYYGAFSSILVINRGVHEPLEEFVFQSLLPHIGPDPTMVELGAYWGHYSMWLKSKRPGARVYLVEPDSKNIAAGKANFARNEMEGTFIQAFVGRGQFQVDEFITEHEIDRLQILHADIQGYEIEMLEGCKKTLGMGKIDHVFISTHSQPLHRRTSEQLSSFGYRIEVSVDLDDQTTSYDGFIFASHTSVPPILSGFVPQGRREIYSGTSRTRAGYIDQIISKGLK